MSHPYSRDDIVKIAVEIAVKLGLLFLTIYIAYRIAKPFLGIVIWAAIIAVALHPFVTTLQRRFGHRKTIVVAVTLFFVAGSIVPAYLLSDTVIATGQQLAEILKNGTLTIPPPTEHVKSWPLIGETFYDLWLSASHNLTQTLMPYKHEIKEASGVVFTAIGKGLGTILMFVAAFVVAAFFLLDPQKGDRFFRHVMRRLVGKSRGDEWANLSVATVRSVVTGVLGVALIQAFFALLGMLAMGIPMAVVWALLIMFLTIVQLPALIVIAPMIAWVFAQNSGTTEILFTIYMLAVGASDSLLKPLLMGRGVDIPMLVILVGAIGGMMLTGMIGLFIGAVVFALAYKLFELWIDEMDEKGTL